MKPTMKDMNQPIIDLRTDLLLKKRKKILKVPHGANLGDLFWVLKQSRNHSVHISWWIPWTIHYFTMYLLCNVTIYSGKNVTDSSLLTISFSFLTVNSFDPSRSSSMVHKIWIYFSKIPKFLFIIQRQWENNFG